MRIETNLNNVSNVSEICPDPPPLVTWGQRGVNSLFTSFLWVTRDIYF